MGRVLIVGCGSIGSRRARLLAGMGHEILLFDSNTPLACDVQDSLPIGTVVASDMWVAAHECPDAAFICTPAHTHVQLAMECVERGIPIFVEKPLSNGNEGLPELLAAVENAGIVNMGACNMRWAYASIPDDATELDFVSWQPLSEWGGDRETYERNGIILESAVHEMDVAVSRLGRIVDAVRSDVGGFVCLDLTHERGFSSTSVSWDKTVPAARDVTWVTADRIDGCVPTISDRMYKQEMAHFLDCVQHNKPTCNPLSNAAHVLDWALKLKEQVGVTA